MNRGDAHRPVRLDGAHALDDRFHEIDHLGAMTLQVFAPHDVVGVGKRQIETRQVGEQRHLLFLHGQRRQRLVEHRRLHGVLRQRREARALPADLEYCHILGRVEPQFLERFARSVV